MSRSRQYGSSGSGSAGRKKRTRCATISVQIVQSNETGTPILRWRRTVFLNNEGLQRPYLTVQAGQQFRQMLKESSVLIVAPKLFIEPMAKAFTQWLLSC
ncbi:MAG: hypothetical protein JOY96_11580 [Verrucomicrobia bacterium]|nr:hypothetical protein [Verrucomicrobiota bacterium]